MTVLIQFSCVNKTKQNTSPKLRPHSNVNQNYFSFHNRRSNSENRVIKHFSLFRHQIWWLSTKISTQSETFIQYTKVKMPPQDSAINSEDSSINESSPLIDNVDDEIEDRSPSPPKDEYQKVYLVFFLLVMISSIFFSFLKVRGYTGWWWW